MKTYPHMTAGVRSQQVGNGQLRPLPKSRLAASDHPENATRNERWSCAPLTVDVGAKQVRCNGRLIELTGRETDIMIALYKVRGHPLSQAMLWERCWIGKGWSYFPEEFANTVDQAIKRLRKSLKRQCTDIADDHHPLVSNVWAQGFALRDLSEMPR